MFGGRARRISIVTQSTVNEPGRLGDQARQMGRICSRITNVVIEKTLVELKLKTIYDQIKMRRESPIHTILNPPGSNNNSSCTMKEAITNISQQSKYSELI
jgi:hypothetical protein